MTRSTKSKPTLTPTVRCAIYTRKSTEDGLEQDYNSLDAQRDAAEAFIASQKQEGWVAMPFHYDDGGFTGGTMERPGLRRLLADIAAGQIDCVIVYKVDRLSRSLLDFARLIETFETHKVAFVSVTQQFNTSNSMGRLVLNVLLSFAQFERDIIGERIRDKIAATKKKGKWAGGSPVLGYEVNRTGPSPKLVVHAQEAARVREIFRLYDSLGSLLPVVDELARRHWNTKSRRTSNGKHRGDKPFDKCSLHALLTNPIYLGLVRHKEQLYPGEHDPIIDEVLYHRVQSQLRRNAQSGGPLVRNRHGALLRGLLSCVACERAMTHTFTTKGSKRYRYYTCTAAIKAGRKACPSPSLPAAEVERVVIEQIQGIAHDKALRREVLRQANSQMEAEAAERTTERDHLQRERNWHHAEVTKLARLGSGQVETIARIADLHERISRGETRLREIQEWFTAHERNRISGDEVDHAFDHFDRVWDALTPREQAEAITLLVARVDFDAGESAISVSFHPTAFKSLSTVARGVT